ncbi:transposon Tf2-9 polyprotein [Trichonephila clavata]|uniref:Transposon Tf2-9 polyprotein n=1 Tax=Trichonephila clavata TaxID=2740835 RepID=A0A8X6H288_TRICU|nr:transposon Tf2-9 polyprotein [Trichonephila clavata]
MHRNGVKHETSAPFKPSSNGQAERYVGTLKLSLRALHKHEAMLFLRKDIRTRTDLLLSKLKTKIQDKLRRDSSKFRDRKFDVADRVAVRVYTAADTRWKFGTIVSQDGVIQYTIDVQGALVKRNVDQIRPHPETAEDISEDLNKEFGLSSVQEAPSTDVAVRDISQSSVKEIDSGMRSPPVPERSFPRRSGRIRRPPERLVLSGGRRCGVFNCNQLKTSNCD